MTHTPNTEIKTINLCYDIKEAIEKLRKLNVISISNFYIETKEN